jgi:hypothetical protein
LSGQAARPHQPDPDGCFLDQDLIETAARFRATLDRFSADPTIAAFREVQAVGRALDEARRVGSQVELRSAASEHLAA